MTKSLRQSPRLRPNCVCIQRVVNSRGRVLPVSPCPASTEIEFSDAVWRGVRIVKNFERKDDSHFLEEPWQDGTSVSQTWEFDFLAIDVLNDRAFTSHDQL